GRSVGSATTPRWEGALLSRDLQCCPFHAGHRTSACRRNPRTPPRSEGRLQLGGRSAFTAAGANTAEVGHLEGRWPSARAFALQLLHQRWPWQRVDHVGPGQPAFARNTDAEAKEHRLLETMGVRIDHAFDSLGPGVGPEPPIHVEPIRVAVE